MYIFYAEDAIDFRRLLRASRKRPDESCAAESGYEFPASDVSCHPTLQRENSPCNERTIPRFDRDVPLFAEHCEAVAAEDVCRIGAVVVTPPGLHCSAAVGTGVGICPCMYRVN